LKTDDSVNRSGQVVLKLKTPYRNGTDRVPGRGRMKLLQVTFAFVTAIGGVSTVTAQTYPARPIRVIIPTVPAGAADLVVRVVSERLAAAFGQPVVIDNRPGGQGVVGADIVAKASPDGYTLLATSDSFVVQPFVNRKLPFDPQTSFAPITLLTTQTLVLAVHTAVPAANFKEFITLAKSRPGTLSLATGGAAQHLTSELIKHMAGLNMIHVPYNGARALVDLVGGQVQAAVLGASTVRPQARAGKVRILAVTSGSRSPALQDVPTLAESGLSGFDVYQWIGILAPARAQGEIIARLNAEAKKALSEAAVRERLEAAGFVPKTSTPQEVEVLIRDGLARWSKLIKEASLKLNV
jgi:tripartite-type tricarboxylate transporter receptor subunit TctC